MLSTVLYMPSVRTSGRGWRRASSLRLERTWLGRGVPRGRPWLWWYWRWRRGRRILAKSDSNMLGFDLIGYIGKVALNETSTPTLKNKFIRLPPFQPKSVVIPGFLPIIVQKCLRMEILAAVLLLFAQSFKTGRGRGQLASIRTTSHLCKARRRKAFSNKLAKLRRHASRVHFAKKLFRKIHFGWSI